MSSSDYATDGALGVSSSGLNPFVQPGTMYALAAPTNLSANLLANIIASCEDSQVATAYDRTFIDGSGNYYTLAGSTVTKTNTATTNASFYTASNTDMVSFNGKTYVTTSNGDIDLWDTSTLTLTNSWWVGTKSQSSLSSAGPHPMLAYGGALYIANGNKIHAINTAGTIDTFYPALPFTLNSNEIIYALGIDPTTGLMLISVQTIVNIGATSSASYYIYLWDGISAQFYRKIPVDDLVTGFHNVEGTVFVGSGQTLGQWNGNGVTFLRKISGFLLFKHRMTNTRNILHVTDGANVLSYGTVIANHPRAFFHTAYSNATNSNTLTLFSTGDYNLAVADDSTHLKSFSFTSTSAASSSSLYFNNIYFPRPINVHRMRIITTGIPFTGGTDITISILDEKATALPIANSKRILSVPSGTTYVVDFDYGSAKCQAVQPIIVLSNNNYGIVRVIIYYDPAE